jgi:hypothetical protein
LSLVNESKLQPLANESQVPAALRGGFTDVDGVPKDRINSLTGRR